MKTPEEIRNLTESFRIVTKEINKAIDSKSSADRICIAMLLLPLMPAIDEFMKVLKEETKQENEKSSSEDSFDNFIPQAKSNGPVN